MSDAWYLDASDYYVRAGVGVYPVRQGDLIRGFELGGERWLAAQIIHPTCELTKREVREVQVARVRSLADLADDFQRSLAVAGYRELDGQRRVALASTFFLAPWKRGGPACFSNLRELATVPRSAVASPKRLAALTHDCRVTFIRRNLYFRFRLAFAVDDVRAWEARRIGSDPAFEGPRPDWAATAADGY